MELVTYSILTLSAMSLTVGGINLLVWFGDRNRREFLAITCSCISVAVYSWFEIALMKTDSPVLYGEIMWWGHFPAAASIISIAWFVQIYLKTGRLWLFWVIVALRILGLIINFFLTPNVNFKELTAIGQTMILGQSVSFPIGVPNPWVLVGQFGLVLMVVYFFDALTKVWQAGERRKALVVGGGIISFAAATAAIAFGAVWSTAGMPFIASSGFFFILAAMALELNYDVRRSERLAKDLEESKGELFERLLQMDLSAGAANIGIWTKNIGDQQIHASDKWFEIFGLDPSGPLTFERYYRTIHPDDRAMVKEAIAAARGGGAEYNVEYRVNTRNAGVRWIRSLGRFEFEDGKPKFLRGVSVDITKRKLAEEAAHDLSRKLINAQEKERARLARELHDDLSQSLALLSIQLQGLGRDRNDPKLLQQDVAGLTTQIQQLSADVHRISHELHPAKLQQLGLSAALRGFCREIGSAHGINIQFEDRDAPRDLPADIALCLYRIAQESLQNVAKHSGAGIVNVNLGSSEGDIYLSVSDNGCGFDPEATKARESLGLVSISERIRAINGTVSIESVIGAGTKVEAIVPSI